MPETTYPLQDARAIEAELRRLWREASTESKPVMRARVMTLLVVTDEAHESTMAEALTRLMSRHPARTILLALGEDESRGFEASAGIFCLSGEHPLCMEQIYLHCAPTSLERLKSAVRLLLDPSLPSTLWWALPATQHGELREGLAPLVDRVVIDSRVACVPEHLRAPLAGPVDDLAWEATRPWREMVASLFDPADRTPHLEHVARVSVAHGPCPVEGWLMAGWLATCLGWRLRARSDTAWRFESREGRGGTIAFETHEGADGLVHLRLETEAQRYEVVRDEQHATCSVDAARAGDHSVVLPLNEREPLALLSQVLDRLRPDPLYERSRDMLHDPTDQE